MGDQVVFTGPSALAEPFLVLATLNPYPNPNTKPQTPNPKPSPPASQVVFTGPSALAEPFFDGLGLRPPPGAPACTSIADHVLDVVIRVRRGGGTDDIV